jgi:diguanylate cyclase (GGDEF)-like protein
VIGRPKSEGREGLRVPIRGAHADVGSVRIGVEGVAAEEIVERERIVEVVAHHVALAVGGLRTRAKLSEQSLRDPLTKLYNRRWLGDTLRREVARAVRLGKPLAVLAFDVDHFKWFNDHFGHPAGDEVLKTVAATLATGIRAEDFACRQGGEEFLVVMPGADVATAAARAEALRAEIARRPVSVVGGEREPITVSVGVAVFPAHAPSADELLAAADAALYRAKASGRDRVVVVSQGG